MGIVLPNRVITLQAINTSNRDVVACLAVAADQRHLVASNTKSLLQGDADPAAVPLAIYADDTPVGFLMYETLAAEGRPHDYSIYRLMIDETHQGRGYGRAALEHLLALLGQDRALARITICYVPGNVAAARFYASLGFREVGLDDDGEMIAEITCLS